LPLLTLKYRYDNLFRLPLTLLENFQQITGWSPDTKADPNLLIVEPGLLYPQSIGFNGSLIIKLQGYDGEVEIPNYELSHPLRGIATNGTRILDTDLTELNIFHEAPLFDTAVLGKVFLSQVNNTPSPPYELQMLTSKGLFDRRLCQ
jgi:hypothetical protein